jgi:hypothetical protein
MLRKLIAPALAATLVLAACDQGSTAPMTAQVDDDYALVMFGEVGSSLEGTMGTQPSRGPFDGRTFRRPFPDSIKLSQVQIDSIAALRLAFRTEHAAQLDSMKTIFEAARTARQGGATREEVRAILVTARPIALALRVDVVDLHYAIWSVFTDAQKRWVVAHRPRQMPMPMAPPATP